MGLFSFFTGGNITESAADARDRGALIVDVRETDEYRRGHIEGARSVPLSDLASIRRIAPDDQAPLYLYCASGARSARAASQLRSMGYADVTNMGGIMGYRGPLVR
ncbi:MAG: rhodanese-like domain-containing protein [Berryella intestinalis]|uniref:rhodanese-like domain-containing protein n=1 Tax=Berryella intestinalis TaxID=1531429 RepID=UPI000F64412B|nr:rhodanese-like domain-containing protein [Berryella intestinalis]MDD7369349.1 rhodanese-like domain-containing protein [Berryella intestinalis]MDY3130051.1 rhodanese-like domain-containing protein [Berryella intestinalis]